MVGDKTIDIPLIALISHHYLAMDNVQIKFKAKVGSCLLYTSQSPVGVCEKHTEGASGDQYTEAG